MCTVTTPIQNNTGGELTILHSILTDIDSILTDIDSILTDYCLL